MSSTSFARRLATAWTWLRWPLAIGLLGGLFYRHRADFARLGERSIAWEWLFAAFTLCLASVLTTFVRWWLLVWAQGFEFRLRDAMRIGFLGYLFNYVAPGAVGGDLVKAVFLAREQKERRLTAVGTVVVDRIAGLLALFIAGAIAGMVRTDLSQSGTMRTILATYQFASLGGLAGIALLMMPAFVRSRFLHSLTRIPKVGRVLGELINALLLYSHRWRVVLAVLWLSLLGHALMLSTFYCCARGLHTSPDTPGFWEHMQFLPAAELAGVFIPLPGGVGALEGAIAHFYERAGATGGDGMLTGVGYRVISLLIAGVGGIVYASMRTELREAIDAAGNGTDRAENEPSK